MQLPPDVSFSHTFTWFSYPPPPSHYTWDPSLCTNIYIRITKMYLPEIEENIHYIVIIFYTLVFAVWADN